MTSYADYSTDALEHELAEARRSLALLTTALDCIRKDGERRHTGEGQEAMSDLHDALTDAINDVLNRDIRLIEEELGRRDHDAEMEHQRQERGMLMGRRV